MPDEAGKTQRRRFLRLLGVALPVLGLLAGAAACNGTSEELATLQADPMADVELLSAERLSLRETDAGTTLGKPVAATVSQGFIPAAEGASLETVLDEAVAAARSAGWDLVEEEQPQDFWEAERATELGRMRLSIAINESTEPTQVIVRLTMQ